MIVCICRRVCDKTIRAAICNGARCVDDVTRTCRAGGGCGACHEVITEMIDDHVETTSRHLPVVQSYVDQAEQATEAA